MNKYNEEYFSVIDKRTGRKIVDCAEYSDAMLMLNIDPHNRQITRNKFLMGQVVDIEQTEGSNPKWSKPYGTTLYQNDAFIVIKNVSRNPVIPSQPNTEQVEVK